MKIETTPDKLIIDEREVIQMVRAYVLEKTGREVQSDLNFQLRGGSSGDKHATIWCYLQPAAGAA